MPSPITGDCVGGTRPDPGTSGNTRDHSDSQSRQTSLGGDLKLLYQNCTLGRWGENFTGQHELGLSEPDRGFGQNLECFLVIGFSDTFLFKCLTTNTCCFLMSVPDFGLVGMQKPNPCLFPLCSMVRIWFCN